MSYYPECYHHKEPNVTPESRFEISFVGKTFILRQPDGCIQSIAIDDIARVLVETNDSGPVGIDVWWILVGYTEDEYLAFPMGATGEKDAVTILKQRLPGFEIRGMNSTDNARFECWPNPSDK